jgi:hypothetical protein
MKRLMADYRGIKMFIFDDDVFTLDREYVLGFCREYRGAGIGVPFVVNAHVKCFDGEIAAALAAAGCKIVKFGLESGSPRVRREVLHRHMSNDEITRAFETCRRHNLHSSAFLMLGLPTETLAEMFETVRLLALSLPGRFRWSVFFPFPGTQAHDIATKAGLVDEAKMARASDFFSESCLDFGQAHNLALEKLNAAFPWYVNAASTLPCAEAYRRLTARLDAMTREEWERRKQRIPAMDAEVSARTLQRNVRHYAMKYNRFMGVDSEYFTREDT